ncbi:histone chaperone [Blumeria hordei DH14]|uniref:Histone chaperone n=1 Tax=Blumeria graminis f. sp. hordei (strain DH14) TaxID=546991 RepID=N1JGT3_BLUG1|nr:histone chaperone [Blumeria hordei DH14]
MTNGLDEKSLQLAYRNREDLQNAIRNAAAVGPHYIELFNHITAHILSLASEPSILEPESKKRKLDCPQTLASVASGNTHGPCHDAAPPKEALLEVSDISFIMPQRKKFTVGLTQTHFYARLQEVVAGTRVAWSEIEHVFLLPIPEKSRPQQAMLLMPRQACRLVPKGASARAVPPPEPIAFTIPLQTPQANLLAGRDAAAALELSDDFCGLFSAVVRERLAASGNPLPLIEPDAKLFAGAADGSGWVPAFRGSKEGYLFFLPRGILWAFKKPILFFDHADIIAVAITGVLSRTFNLSLEVRTTDGTSCEVEFCLLNQDYYEHITRYVARHGLLDGSLNEARRAKLLPTKTASDEHSPAPSPTLPAAGDANYDDEDEDEEDYDPGSAGESDGSGTSSDEEEPADGADQDDQDDHDNTHDPL